ncbi:MAG: hypothetical protein H6R05_447 [Burkholderiaceae bacterium]|nr:hypothetical protein [Burkholderiaceae bacterium]
MVIASDALSAKHNPYRINPLGIVGLLRGESARNDDLHLIFRMAKI